MRTMLRSATSKWYRSTASRLRPATCPDSVAPLRTATPGPWSSGPAGGALTRERTIASGGGRARRGVGAPVVGGGGVGDVAAAGAVEEGARAADRVHAGPVQRHRRAAAARRE